MNGAGVFSEALLLWHFVGHFSFDFFMGFGFGRLWSFEVVIVFWVMFVGFGDVEFHMFFGLVNFLLEGGELLFE